MAGALLGLLGAVLGGGCDDPFAPAYAVTDFRLLAVVATPTQVPSGTDAVITPVWGAPDGVVEVDATFWTCPLRRDEVLDMDPTCEDRVTLGEGPGGPVAFAPGLFPESFGGPEGDRGPYSTTERWLAAMLGHNAIVGVSGKYQGMYADGFKRVTVMPPARLATADESFGPFDVWRDEGGQLRPNANPVLTAVEVREDKVGGEAVTTVGRGQTVRFIPRYDPDSLESYETLVADFSGLNLRSDDALTTMPDAEKAQRFVVEAQCEIPTFQWYVTGGILRRELTRDVHVVTQVYAPRGVTCPEVPPDALTPGVLFTWPEEGEAVVDDVVHAWVVMRDGRGGTAVRAFDIGVAP